MGLGRLSVSREFLVILLKELMPPRPAPALGGHKQVYLQAHVCMLCVSRHSGEVGKNVDGLGIQYTQELEGTS